MEICSYLEIGTLIKNSWDYELVEGKSEDWQIYVAKQGDHYISGPTAKGYINEKTFLEYGIKLSWFNYDGYPTYPQLWGDFVHGVSILDLLFNCGKDARTYMRNL